jgi:glycosyltransferase involved in cell wall biosynthesis
MKNPLVSIIIPVFNREKYLQETINSVINQTYHNWELILVDDASEDSSMKIMKMASKLDSRINVFSRPKDKPGGGNAARNFGYQMAKGKYLNWFDSDDVMIPDFIEKKVAEFQKDPHLNLVLSKTIRFYPDGSREKETRTKLSDNILEDFITRKLSWYLFDGMFHIDYLRNKELFSENLLAGQDRDFYIRLFSDNLPNIQILDFYSTYYRIHPASISEKIYREGNIKMQLSHYYSLLDQVTCLKKNGKLSVNLKDHYLEELKKRLPAIVRGKAPILIFTRNLIRLSGTNKSTLRVWSQIFPAYISFITFGKGERFLK